MNEIDNITRKRNQIIKRIEEQQRLMELIRNKNITNGLTEIDLFRKKSAAIKIQTAWRRKLNQEKAKQLLIEDKASAKYKHVSAYKGVELTFAIVKIQRAIRTFLTKVDRERIRVSYLDSYWKSFYDPISFDRAAELQKEIVMRLKAMFSHEEKDYTALINNYYTNYYQFCVDFPYHMEIRDNKILFYYQCLALVEHIEKTNNLELLSKFTQFKLNENQKNEIKREVDQILESIESKAVWYQYSNIDDFEEENMLNEIDLMYNFENRSDILRKK